MLITLITVRVLLNSEKCEHGPPLVWDKPYRISGLSESNEESQLRASAQLGYGVQERSNSVVVPSLMARGITSAMLLGRGPTLLKSRCA